MDYNDIMILCRIHVAFVHFFSLRYLHSSFHAYAYFYSCYGENQTMPFVQVSVHTHFVLVQCCSMSIYGFSGVSLYAPFVVQPFVFQPSPSL